MTSILDQIVNVKRREVASLRENVDAASFSQGQESTGLGKPSLSGERSTFKAARPSFRDALIKGARGRHSLALIAEIKKASPSEGVIRDDFNPLALAQAYERAGASAISVLTDREFFQGGLEDLRRVVEVTNLPVLRKDFIIDSLQIHEAAQAGASAILLIAAILDEFQLREFRELAESLGMDALIEVHDEVELTRALRSGAAIVGINNRDLHTFRRDLNRTFMLLSQIPKDVVVVSESGIRNRMDVARLTGFVDATLVGTSLMSRPDLEAAVHELFVNRPVLKVCGIQEVETAQFCAEQGIELLGLNFYEPSRRSVTIDQAEQIICSTRSGSLGASRRGSREISCPDSRRTSFGSPREAFPQFVGLFVDAPLDYVNEVVRRLDLDYVQLHGQESPEYCAAVERPVIKAFSMDSCGEGESRFEGVYENGPCGNQNRVVHSIVDDIRPFQGCIDFPLVDLPKGLEISENDGMCRGGESEARDGVERPIQLRASLEVPYGLAGGLTSHNLKAVLDAVPVRPFLIDVARGVEEQWCKSPAKIVEFLNTLNQIFHE